MGAKKLTYNPSAPHFGIIQKVGAFKTLFSIFTSTSRKSYLISMPNIELQRLQRDSYLLLSISSKMIIITEPANPGRKPIIQKQWCLKEEISCDLVDPKGKYKTFIDIEGLTWSYYFNTETREEHLTAFDNCSKEVVTFFLEL